MDAPMDVNCLHQIPATRSTRLSVVLGALWGSASSLGVAGIVERIDATASTLKKSGDPPIKPSEYRGVGSELSLRGPSMSTPTHDRLDRAFLRKRCFGSLVSSMRLRVRSGLTFVQRPPESQFSEVPVPTEDRLPCSSGAECRRPAH